jgi:hypothetical protein
MPYLCLALPLSKHTGTHGVQNMLNKTFLQKHKYSTNHHPATPFLPPMEKAPTSFAELDSVPLTPVPGIRKRYSGSRTQPHIFENFDNFFW